MRSRFNSILVDVAVVLALGAVAGLCLAVAAGLGAMMALIFGGSAIVWACVFCAIDLVAIVIVLHKVIRDYWNDYEERLIK